MHSMSIQAPKTFCLRVDDDVLVSFSFNGKYYTSPNNKACVDFLNKDEFGGATCTLVLDDTIEIPLPLQAEATSCLVPVPHLNLVFKIKLFNNYGDTFTKQFAHIQFLRSNINFAREVDGIVPHAAYCPGHLMFMQQCDIDVWQYTLGCTSISDEWLLSYMEYGARLLGKLASLSLEARNYKAKNVGWSHSAFQIVDVSQILPVGKAHSAVCTLPASMHYTYGNSHFVGLAATAWAFLADMGALMGYGIEKISFLQVQLTGSAQPARAYQNPIHYVQLYAFLHECAAKENWPCTQMAMIVCLQAYRRCFMPGHVPLTIDTAVKHAIDFFNAAQNAIANARLYHSE